jgi:pSer/pThr/pTyr-binding forkhead associated (FHA) protein
MMLRFSVSAGRKTGQGGGAEAEPWHVVDAPLIDGQLLIGRKPDCAIALPFAAISAHHARIAREANGYRVEDLGSANGTLLGARRLQSHAPLPLAAGEILDVAGIRLRFDGELPDQEASVQGRTDTLARRLVHEVFSACPPGEAVRLVGLDGPGAACELALLSFERPLLVGRGETCDLVLSDEDVSREHAALERSSAGITLRDLGSKNGVEVWGERISGSCRLRDGDVVRIGQTSLRLVDPEERYLRQVQDADAAAQADLPSPASSPGTSAGWTAMAVAAAANPASPQSSDGETAGSTAPPDGVSVQARSSRLPALARAVAALALLWVVGLVLALAFGY